MALPHWYANPSARHWRTTSPSTPRAFHRTLAGYDRTPLTPLPSLAAELGVGHVFLKDESRRLGLPAFKILGASWAACRALSERYRLDPVHTRVPELQAHLSNLAAHKRPVLVTATDGNHGRAVARIAAMLGLGARVYVPDGVSLAAIQAIRDEGADVIGTDSDYDCTVRQAARSTERSDFDVLVQDTSWPGYTTIPGWIVEGYTTLFDEVDEALGEVGLLGPHMVACPVGVGSFAHAMVNHYRSRHAGPSLLSVEPETAACLALSLRAGAPVSVETSFTVMTGMNCGTPSELSWPALFAGIDAAISVSDDECRQAIADLRQLGQDVGPCGASTLAGVRLALASQDRREVLGIDEHSVLVLVSTEGIIANPRA
jgi:diaminopropionate ammonia-lyase